MIYIIGSIWFIASLYTIYYVDHYCYWKHLFKVFFVCCIIAFLYNGVQLYDPTIDHMIVTIETNPTWNAALILSIAEGTCLTGPIAAIHAIKERRG